MTDFVRVKDTETGNEFTAAAESHYAQDEWVDQFGTTTKNTRFKVVDKPAVGSDGLPLTEKGNPLQKPNTKAEEASK